MKYYFMSILRCFHNSYYKGVTSNPDLRFSQYQAGRFPESYTHKRRPVELVFFYVFNDINQTTAFEKQVKGWSRKKKLLQMIIGINQIKVILIMLNKRSKRLQLHSA